MAASPIKSPRLPSPPPIAEDQLGPNSPLSHTFTDASGASALKSAKYAASRRIRPGTRSEDMSEGPPIIELQEIDSAFQLTEHLKALYAAHVTPDRDPDTIRPIDKETALKLVQPPDGVDRGIWLYELCRFLTQKANVMAVGLFAADPPCSAQTCHEMRASEWQYLCAAHDPPKSCCAIDYCCHTLDWAATQLTNSTLFPSRLALGTEGATLAQQLRKMTEIFRRLYRIFAHAWFQHHEVFWQIENKTGLYVFFKTVCDEYKLIPEDNYTVPPEAEGTVAAAVAAASEDRQFVNSETRPRDVPAGNVTIARGNTTKRHRGSRMEQSNSISIVIHEEAEDDPRARIAADASLDSSLDGNGEQGHPPSQSEGTSLPFRPKQEDQQGSGEQEEDILTAIDRTVDESLKQDAEEESLLDQGASENDATATTNGAESDQDVTVIELLENEAESNNSSDDHEMIR